MLRHTILLFFAGWAAAWLLPHAANKEHLCYSNHLYVYEFIWSDSASAEDDLGNSAAGYCCVPVCP